ncbi:MAG: NAD-binding protein [Haloplanus sp.]
MRLQSIVSTSEESTTGTDDEYVVLGGGHVGSEVARRLRAAGNAVTVVDKTHDPTDPPGVRGDPADRRTLDRAGITDATTVVVAIPDDARGLLAAGLVRAHFGAADVWVLVWSPGRCDLVADAGHEPICVTTALSDAVVANLERPWEIE